MNGGVNDGTWLGRRGKIKDMRYVCLTESGDWQTYVISGKLCKMKGYEICLPHRTGRLANICYIRKAI
jgi:hypothetical protein